MYGNREGSAKTFSTFRASTKCREIGKAGRRLSLRLEPALNVGKARRRLSLRSGSKLNVRKYGKQGEDFPYVSDLH